MSMEQGTRSALEQEVEKAEIISGLRHALDLKYRHLCQLARADWEHLFGSDPADACITVRIQTKPSPATRGSGFLKSRRQSIPKTETKSSVPRFAH